jgi:16S rRNA U516 pseudouridylate synthase RsuA-like enzyme
MTIAAVNFVHQFGIFSREGKVKVASKSEVARWIRAGAVRVNGEALDEREAVDFPLISVVLFPKGKRVTLL